MQENMICLQSTPAQSETYTQGVQISLGLSDFLHGISNETRSCQIRSDISFIYE